MKLPSFVMQGLMATLLIGAPFWYLMVNYYPQYADNYLYLGLGGIAFLAFAAMGAKFASRRK